MPFDCDCVTLDVVTLDVVLDDLSGLADICCVREVVVYVVAVVPVPVLLVVNCVVSDLEAPFAVVVDDPCFPVDVDFEV